MKKPPQFDEKTRKKTGGLINKKSLKLDEKTRRKTDYLYIVKVKNLQNLARKMEKKT